MALKMVSLDTFILVASAHMEMVDVGVDGALQLIKEVPVLLPGTGPVVYLPCRRHKIFLLSFITCIVCCSTLKGLGNTIDRCLFKLQKIHNFCGRVASLQGHKNDCMAVVLGCHGHRMSAVATANIQLVVLKFQVCNFYSVLPFY